MDILESIDKIGERVHRVLIPLVHGKGNWKNTHVNIQSNITGWYWLEIGETKEDYFFVTKKATPVEITRIALKENNYNIGYVFNNEFIPFSFNTIWSKFPIYEGFCLIRDTSFPLLFYSKPWTMITAYFDYDNFYFINVIPPIKQLIEIRNRFENRQNLEGLKGITPELRHLFFLHCLERSTQEELEKAKKEEEFKKTLMGRIKSAIEEAGGYLERIYQRGENVEIVWKIGDEQFNSIVRATNLRVKEAGYCLSGGDERLSLKAAVLTAQDYIEKDLIYKTRY